MKKNKRFKEISLYIIFGLATTVLNVGVYRLLVNGLDYRISNLIALVISKLFAYSTNKVFVFESRCKTFKEVVFEFFRFFFARGMTGLLDFFGLIVAVEVFHFDRIWSKYIMQVIVIVLNYILSKTIVFKIKNDSDELA